MEFKAKSQSANMESLKEYTFIIDELKQEIERTRD